MTDSTHTETMCGTIYRACDDAIRRGVLIRRAGRRDKEFPFQDWFTGRLEDAGIRFDQSGRNAYPDFSLVHTAEGYETKGLAWPGRDADFDANSRCPSGLHNGRVIFYVFGRYPAQVIEDEFPLVDLVICHGDFLNAHHEYVHANTTAESVEVDPCGHAPPGGRR